MGKGLTFTVPPLDSTFIKTRGDSLERDHLTTAAGLYAGTEFYEFFKDQEKTSAPTRYTVDSQSGLVVKQTESMHMQDEIESWTTREFIGGIAYALAEKNEAPVDPTSEMVDVAVFRLAGMLALDFTELLGHRPYGMEKKL